MSIIAYIFEIVLLIWFFGCIVTYRLGNVLLVEGMGIKSAEFGMLVVYAAGIALRMAYRRWGIGLCLPCLSSGLWYSISAIGILRSLEQPRKRFRDITNALKAAFASYHDERIG